ncbi:hypothetical protein DFO67_11473 [Modicisalibacter xianhensis]|uniref:Uncharacterized protein n=1 Tax=Modicisalibacter xianhensis TaxID=442341 RepID=A0A4R8FL79_9GAMM|nr:hypothetical protein [Halomonas xianhensis]TDX26989.1 hypothetical protein DFO67_11473 [Halomonas xianhensis]
MYTRYKVVKGVKPLELQDETVLAEHSYATWWRIKDMDTRDPLAGGFESLRAAQDCCHDLNSQTKHKSEYRY